MIMKRTVVFEKNDKLIIERESVRTGSDKVLKKMTATKTLHCACHDFK